MRMPFGKHRGKLLETIPHDYLLWVLDNCDNLSPTVRNEVQRILGIGRHSYTPPQTPLAVSTVNEWYRRLAREFHPDLGGSHEAMKAVNRGRELMLELVK
ncbi:MAG: hypothetical protein GXX96_11360 [Planctomycetaceae bacterium]|nr:hypothetical protein [Planctomycetaceae bacterium]